MRILFVLLLVFSFQNCFAQITSFQQTKDIKIEIDSLLEVKEYDKAIQLYESMLMKIDFIDAQIYYEIAGVYYDQNKYKETLTYLDKSINLIKTGNSNQLMASIHFLYARTYSKQVENKKVIPELKKSLKYKKLTETYVTLAYRYIKEGKNKKAVKSAKKAIEMNPKEPYAYNNAGLALIKLKKYEEGRKMIMTSLELDSTNPYAYKHLAYYYIAVKDLDKACKALNKADELGYKDFGNEADQNEVEELIKKHCK